MQPFERKFLKSTRNFFTLNQLFFLFFFFGAEGRSVLSRGGGGCFCLAVQPQTEVGSSPILLNCHRIQAVKHSF